MLNSTDRTRRHRRATAGLALALVAAAVAVGSGADFSARTANPENTFTAGALSMSNSRDGSAIFNVANLVPGAPGASGIVDIGNTGSIRGRFSLSRGRLSTTDKGDPSPAPLDTKVGLKVSDCGTFDGANAPSCGVNAKVVYGGGTLASMTQAIPLGTFAPGEKHRYEFEATLDSSAGNEYAGDMSSAEFVWDAVQ